MRYTKDNIIGLMFYVGNTSTNKYLIKEKIILDDEEVIFIVWSKDLGHSGEGKAKYQVENVVNYLNSGSWKVIHSKSKEITNYGIY